MQDAHPPHTAQTGRSWKLGLAVALSALLLLTALLQVANASDRLRAAPDAMAPPDEYLSQDTIRIAFPLGASDSASASQAADDFAELLSRETGLDVQASILPCEEVVVEHLGTGRADLAPLRQVAYVLGHGAYGIEARLVVKRYGGPRYWGQINVQASGNYTDIGGLQG